MIGNKSCKLASSLASDASERNLSFTERLRLNLHTLVCRSCRNCKREMRLLHDILTRIRRKDTLIKVDLPQKDREIIRDALRNSTNKQ